MIPGLGEIESVLEFSLPVAVGGKRKPVGHFARGVELQQLVRHVAHLGLDAGFGFGPSGAAHAVEGGFAFAGAAETLDQVHARQRDVEFGSGGVFEQHVVALGVAQGDLAQTQELGYAVVGVYHEVAGLEIDQIGGERPQRRLAGGSLGDQFGSFKEILGTEDDQFRILECRAAPDQPFDEVNAGHRAGHVDALREIGRSGLKLLHAELVSHSILVEDVSQPFYFTCSRRKESHPVPRLHQRTRFGDGHLDVAVKALRGPGRYVGRRAHANFQFLHHELRQRLGRLLELLPAVENAAGSVDRRGLDLLQTLPEPLGGAAHLARFVPDNERLVGQGEDRSGFRAHHRR